MNITSKRIVLSVVASAMLSTVSLADTQEISLEDGWNLVGTKLSNVDVKSDLSGVDSTWSWDAVDQKWNVYSTDEAVQQKIDTLVQAGEINELTTLNFGDGFWVNNSSSKNSVLLNGTSTSTQKSLSLGWNLVSFDGEGSNSKGVSDVFGSIDGIYIVWEYDNGTWKAWSPLNSVQNTISFSGYGNLTSIQEGKGYWVNATKPSTIGIDITPPDATLPNFVYVSQVIGDGGQVVSLGDVSIYNAQTEEYYGKTDSNGKFDITPLGIADGTPLKAIKEGYTNTVGVVKNGFVTFSLMPLKVKPSVEMEAKAIGDTKPLPKFGFIATDYATVEVEPSTADQSLTFTLSGYKNPASLPKITENIVLDGKSTTPDEISVVGAANINLKGSDKKTIVNPSTMDGKLNYNYKLEKFIGDFESILNGLTGSTNKNLKKFNPQALELLNKAIEDKLIGIYLIQQQPDGSWTQVDKAIPVVESDKIKLKKATQGSIKTFGAGNLAYIIKTEAVKGSTQICFEQAGYRMNDGKTVVSADENNASIYEWIGDPVEGLVLLGDGNVIGQPQPSAETGCTTIEYKVPYLAPMYQVTAVSEGNFDKTVVVDVEFGNLNKPYDDNNVSIYKVPEKATIQGYIKSTLEDGTDEQSVGEAIVTLQDPQILTKQKVLVDNENGKKTITLEANPNVEYTYTLTKEDDTDSVVIKSGTLGDDSDINILTQEDVESIIYGTTPADNPWLDNPYGNYIISIQAVHTYAPQNDGGDNLTLTEQMLVTFRAKVDETALVNAFSYSVNQGDAPWYKDSDGDGVYEELSTDTNNTEKVDNELSEISIFGGKDISVFKPLAKPYDEGYIGFPDESTWETYIISYGSSLGESLADLNDPNPYLPVILEANLETPNFDTNQVKLVLPKTQYNKQYMKFSQVYKIFNENFPTLVTTDFSATTDDVVAVDSDENITVTIKEGQEIPLYQSGFTVFNSYQATFERAVNYRTYAGSYTSLDWFKLNSVDDFSDILDFKVSANDPIAFSTRYTTSEDNGFYQINQIAPEAIPSLELTVRAEGHAYTSANERLAGYPQALNGSFVTGIVDPEAGDVLTHDFMLTRFAVDTNDTNITFPDENTTIEIPEVVPTLPLIDQTFEDGLQDWEIVELDISGYSNPSDSAKWHVVENANVPQVNNNWATMFNDGETETILPTPFGDYFGWMGDLSTGTYSDSGSLHGTNAVATALKSPVIDFANFSLGTLNFKQWFEASAYDGAFDTAFVGFEIQGDDENSDGTTIKLKDAGGYSAYVTVGQTYITRVTPSVPLVTNYDQGTYVSNNGLHTQPSWTEYKVPLDMLAGKKAKIVFGFFTKDTLYNNNRGWGVDNIFIQDSVENIIELPPMVPTLEDTSVLDDIINTDVNKTGINE